MTTTLSVKGQILIPQRIRAGQRLKAGTDFTVITRSHGDILLRPVKSRRQHATLGDNLLALSGFQFDVDKASARDIDVCQ